MTEFVRSISFTSKGALVAVPRRRLITERPNVPKELEVGLNTNYETDPYVYTVGGTPYYPTDAWLTPPNQPVTFTANVVEPVGVNATEYYWTFGDGFDAYGPIVSHTYLVPTPHTQVVLRVTDNLGRTYYVRRQMYFSDTLSDLVSITDSIVTVDLDVVSFTSEVIPVT